MPKLGNTVEECLLTAWWKHQGDTVCAGDIIAEVETDKASFEITAPADGILLDTFFDEGAVVPVFTNICVIGAAGETGRLTRPPAGGRVGAGLRARNQPQRTSGGNRARARARPDAGADSSGEP